jgi:hypothetical protein
MLRKLLRPLGFVGCLIAGGLIVWFTRDKIQKQIDKMQGNA